MSGRTVALFLSCCLQLSGCRRIPPKRTAGGADSPVQAFAVAGRDVVLRCDVPGLHGASGVRTWEWSKDDGGQLKTALAVRGGVELMRDKEAGYVDRTAPLVNRSMELRGVRLTDTGLYVCKSFLDDGRTLDTRVSLIVGEVSELSVIVSRSEDGGLDVLCEVRVRGLELTLTVLDHGGNALHAQTQAWDGPDHAHHVRVQRRVEPTGENVTLTCRWNVSGEAEQKKVTVSDRSTSAGCSAPLGICCCVSMLLIFCVGCFLVVQKRKLLSGLWRKMTALTAGSQRAATEEEEEHFTEYRNLEEMRTTGVSAVTATANNLTREGDLVLGVEGSEILAKKDLKPMSKYRNQIMNVGRKLRLHPALIAAMISKQSNAGQQLKPDGHGMHDANSYGLMQINRKFHAVKGEPFSEDHIDEGSTYLIHLIKTVTNWRPDWSREQHLKGALVCYMVGLEKEKLNYDGELDQQTPTRDFANDVIARAQFYAENGFRV
ncbi:uncharacterized protein LOC101156609 isoform X1 [Oryzias latipes]|nr:uncharacterized protein LOC101156609 isoform X1 [Oryzias latipes]